MSAFLTFDSVSAHTPDRNLLFSGLTLSVGSERIGLVGRNGSGKSTLLRIAAGAAAPADGAVQRAGSVGMLAQEWPGHLTLAEALGVAPGMAAIQRILSGAGRAEDFDTADWTLEPRIGAALAAVGLAGLSLDRRMGSLSGGERARAGIARVQLDAPDILLLDEPTNNLDAAGRAAIHDLIRGWRGGVLAASHDRALLEMMDRIVELTPIGIRIVGGGWSAFAASRAADRAKAAAELDRSDAAVRAAQQDIQRQREAKARRDKAGRAFAAKGSEPNILLGAQAERAENSGAQARRIGERLVADAAAKAQTARARVEVLTPLTIALPATGLPSGAQLLKLDAAMATIDGQNLGPWTLDIRGPERIAVTGPNGAGKTTLLQIAAGTRMPSSGAVWRADGRIAMLDQHVELLARDDSILASFHRLNPGLGDEEAHAACARFAFRNRDALRTVATLSGGERLRAGLACTLGGGQAPWLLILDEPTNHLDIESVELLEKALGAFDGALMVVSHDAAFLDAIGIERMFRLDRPSIPKQLTEGGPRFRRWE